MLRAFSIPSLSASCFSGHQVFAKRFEATRRVLDETAKSPRKTGKLAVQEWIYKEIGAFETKEWRGLFYSWASTTNCTTKGELDEGSSHEWKPISPWHDLPRAFPSSLSSNHIAHHSVNGSCDQENVACTAASASNEEPNFSEVVAVVEIPQGSFAKLEMSKELPFNPIVQDVYKKKANQPLRYLMYEPQKGVPFHYGFIPRTFEDPLVTSSETGCPGDGDPLDVVFLDPKNVMGRNKASSSTKICARNAHLRGSAWRCKVLGVLPMVDEGETDWKVIVEPLASLPPSEKSNSSNSSSDPSLLVAPSEGEYRDISHVSPDVQSHLYHWFRYYKTCDGKPETSFAMDGKLQSAEFAAKVIKDCALQYDLLLQNKEIGQKERNSDYWF